MGSLAATPLYKYNRLAHDHFRVMEVIGIDPTLSIRLLEFPDDTPPEYYALSYAWGSESKTATITCNGQSLAVTPHLRDGLRSICITAGRPRLWVDAICIDQAVDQEKSEQVAKMHHIYRRAQGVYVWLGEGQDCSDEVVDAINRLDPKIMARPQLSDDEMGQRFLRIKFESPKLFDVLLFKPLAALSRRAWFTRLWVAQECFFAKTLRFFCGDRQVDGVCFLEVLQNLTINSFGTVEPPGVSEEADLFSGFAAFKEVMKIKEEKPDGRKRRSLLDFIVLGRSRLSNEAVDRIYAVLGMTEGWDEAYQRHIPVDYSEEARTNYWKLYCTFGKMALVREPNLRLLSIACSEERPVELPSWCPNFHSPMKTQSMGEKCSYSAGWSWSLHGRRSNFGTCTRHSHFKGKEVSHVVTSPSSNTISIWGAALGRISAVGRTRNWDLRTYSDDVLAVQPLALAILQWLWDCERFCKEHCGEDARALYVWGEVLVGAGNKNRRPSKTAVDENRGDRKRLAPPEGGNTASGGHDDNRLTKGIDTGATDDTGEGEETDEARADQGSSENDPAYSFLKRVLNSVVMLDASIDWRDQSPGILELLQICCMWLVVIEESWENRVLFATENGHIGHASEEIMPGDDVVVLYGGPTMYVLRESDSEYRFIAEAYVYGCVDGEIFEMMDDGLATEKLFQIS